MLKDKDRQSIDVSRLYYQSEYSQHEIANLLNISRPTVSKLLKYAKESGYVTIEINDPMDISDDLALTLKNKYDLEEVAIAYSPLNNEDEIKNQIGRVAAQYLHDVVKDGDTIGVSWGTTMYALATQLVEKELKDVQIVQLKGGLSHTRSNTYASEINELFAKAFHAEGRALLLPVIFDTQELKEITEKDSHINEVMQMGKQANIAIFSTGTVEDDALLFRLGYFNEEEKKRIQKYAVGDVCSRFIDRNGKICDEKINTRTVGIDLEELKKKERSILVAGGERKLNSLHVALSSKIANTLVTDQFTAKLLLGR
ncbi:sugar-binding transcriptional regulator [Clostridium botulinum]|uniref:Deoxyribonucleoside regulator n=1 Tax=Clostridium botulinum (strain Okra / Type B1) TaxID=498213 RepID=B1ILA0_CLOBK|nr:sugar-binding transcriptional regulator [Clostridium botulinum]EKX79745.1 deoxyribonucleoside regulator [Clostridium botulinum CFSAN001628]ACA44342.1 deoxyribonucleoside regulator [Clostridium botulinum B1 str. Okra]MBD5564654.1 sugar-binding transcriptional regulator [Clostridium botulinum]MBD5566063.1 sugar-binding transcriptional regulator [Clostridium botulinum]MBD5569421.1 sugar-binding transcriptional regulator [Clostridium botulinum]